mgnify:CR=1 FL=1
MDAIKKKLMCLSSETHLAEERAKKYEEEASMAANQADQLEEQLRTIQKKYHAVE